jgi:uncharacterized membrane protein
VAQVTCKHRLRLAVAALIQLLELLIQVAVAVLAHLVAQALLSFVIWALNVVQEVP